VEWMSEVWAVGFVGFWEGNVFGVAVVSFVVMVLTERALAAVAEGPGYDDERDFRANVVSQIFTALFDALVGGVLFVGAYLWVYDHFRLFELDATPGTWLLVFLLNDLRYFADHWFAHRVGLWWAIHASHHSSKQMNLLIANRTTVLAGGGATELGNYVLALVGVPLPMLLVVRFFANLWGIFNHTRLVRRMGWLDEVLMTPGNHRVHHGIEPHYLDRNFAQVLTIWDRLFGTFRRESAEPRFGLVSQVDHYSLWDIQTGGFQALAARMASATRLRDKLAYLVMPPSWRHAEPASRAARSRHQTAQGLQSR